MYREPIETVETDVACEATDSRFAIALSRILAAIRVSAANRIALTIDASA